MATFTLSQSLWEFAKSRDIRTSVVYMPTCQTRTNFSFLRATCQKICRRAKKCANVPKNMPTCLRCANFSTWRAKCVPILQFRLLKGVPIFQLFFKRIFQFFIFSIMLNICKFQDYLANSRKLILRNKELNFDISKISLRKSLVNLKPIASFSVEQVGLTEQLFG